MDTPNSDPEGAPDPLARFRAERARRVAEHDALRETPAFVEQVTVLDRLTSDFTIAIRSAWLMSTRHQPFDNLLAWRFLDDLFESAIAIHQNASSGMHNPVRRELRYCLESAVKNLYTDQQFPMAAPVGERIAYLDLHVLRSRIEDIDNTTLTYFWSDAKPFIDDVKGLYSTLCAYVHPSRLQLEERLQLTLAGRAGGFETPQELRRLNSLLSRSYDILLVFVFHGLGAGLTGDLFTAVFDEQRNWKFHRTKWVKQVSAFFDYKVERQRH